MAKLDPNKRRRRRKAAKKRRGPVVDAPAKKLPTLPQLFDRSNAALGGVDVALLNLLCAVGLPGAEDLDIPRLLGTLDQWAELIRVETDRNYDSFLDAPGAYNNSQAYFCVLFMITVLQTQCGVRYNPKWTGVTPEKPIPRDFGRDARDGFIHAIIDGAGGTCGSLPVLYVAVGRRLGYPLKIVKAYRHLFLRWDDPKRKHWFHADRFNIEATGPGIHVLPDEHYKTWPHKIPQEDVDSGLFLKSLSPREELAEFVAARGYCLRSNRRFGDAITTLRRAVKLAPHNWRFRQSVDELVTHRKILTRGPFLNAPTVGSGYGELRGPRTVRLCGAETAVIQVMHPGLMTLPTLSPGEADAFDGFPCQTAQQRVQLPNGQWAQAEVPLARPGRPIQAAWLWLDGGRYALVHKLAPHGPPPPLSTPNPPSRFVSPGHPPISPEPYGPQPILPDPATTMSCHTANTRSVLRSDEEWALRNAVHQLSQAPEPPSLSPPDPLSLPPGPYAPRLETAIPQISK